jgi:hypothetical protein
MAPHILSWPTKLHMGPVSPIISSDALRPPRDPHGSLRPQTIPHSARGPPRTFAAPHSPPRSLGPKVPYASPHLPTVSRSSLRSPHSSSKSPEASRKMKRVEKILCISVHNFFSLMSNFLFQRFVDLSYHVHGTYSFNEKKLLNLDKGIGRCVRLKICHGFRK